VFELAIIEFNLFFVAILAIFWRFHNSSFCELLIYLYNGKQYLTFL
jgi:hypothetical protein